MKRLFVTVVVVSSLFSGLLITNAQASVVCSSADTAGCTNGLPTDTYLTKNVSANRVKEELVIVVKPTIIEFVPEG